VEFGQEANKVLKAAFRAYRTDQAITNIELAFGGVSAQPIERRALVATLGTADAMILVDLDDISAPAHGARWRAQPEEANWGDCIGKGRKNR
jgi:hypothetical protein